MLTAGEVIKLHDRHNIYITENIQFNRGVVAAFTRTMHYVFAIARSSEMPTDEEIVLIEAFQRFMAWRHFSINPDTHMPKAEGCNTLIITKRKGKWRYRRCNWDVGPLFVPQEGVDLLTLFDRIEDLITEPWKFFRIRLELVLPVYYHLVEQGFDATINLKLATDIDTNTKFLAIFVEVDGKQGVSMCVTPDTIFVQNGSVELPLADPQCFTKLENLIHEHNACSNC